LQSQTPKNKRFSVSRPLATEADTLALGSALAHGLTPGLTIYLIGELGAGKTTLARGLLRGLGYTGRVKSPTYTLVELYKISRLYLYHFDFYRLEAQTEWIDAGFKEYFSADSVCLVEWPERAGLSLPPADVEIRLTIHANTRHAQLVAASRIGQCVLQAISPQSAASTD
jgi:tRNA threonylcarbamoyladenosine biosynthesis protein TsaE